MDPNRIEPQYSRAPTDPDDREPGRTNILEGSFWMVLITLLLFFVPAINGLIGGLVGGYRVGGVKRALLAAILPAVIAAAGLWAIVAAMDRPIFGFFAGATLGVIIALSDVGMFVGAAIGGAMSPRGRTRI